MSLLARRMPAVATAASTPTARLGARTFASTAAQRDKTATEKVKDGLKTVDRAVSDKIVGGIELGESLAEKAKHMAGRTKHDASSAAETAKEKGRSVAEEAKHEAKATTEEAKAKAEEVKRRFT